MHSLYKSLENDACVITPNNRLSAILLEDFYHFHAKDVIKKPLCLPYNTLLHVSYQQLSCENPDVSHPTLLSDSQIHFLWRKLLRSHDEYTFSEGLLSSVISAWNNCLLWGIDIDDPAFYHTPQTQQFQRWWKIMDATLMDLNAIGIQKIVDYWISFEFSLKEKNVIWFCFDSFTPSQKKLQHFFEQQGIQQLFLDLPSEGTSCFRYAAQNTEEECQQLLLFLKTRLEKHERRIGVVVPDLEQQANVLQRFLSRHLAPDSFNISLGKSMKQYPLVAHAMTFLSIDRQKFKVSDAKLLFISPYLQGSKKELENRTQYLQNGKAIQVPLIDWQSMMAELKPLTPILYGLLEALVPFPAQASVQEWGRLFRNRLEMLGFPGEYGLYSENYQCYMRFQTLFEELEKLDVITSSMSKSEALGTLHHIASNTIFQPQAKSEPIQILGLLEASGCRFDSLWITGLTDQCLPEKVRLSPFIPPQLQKEWEMPHSIPSRELHFAQAIIGRFKNCAPLGIFSFPGLTGDSPNLPSPLIMDLNVFIPIEIPDVKSIAALIPVDEKWLIPHHETNTHGGTNLLSNQAQCPFKAFAAHRLHAKPLPEISDGIDNKTRGILLHRVMEKLWFKLKDQHTLKSLSETELNIHIEKSIIDAYEKTNIPEFIKKIEYIRLKKLVLVSLRQEKEREPFQVLHLEKSFPITLQSLDFQVRIDRIDQEQSGKQWVIDYKSTLPYKPWLEDRPREPQMLLYALLDENIRTLLFMEMKSGKTTLSGIADEKPSIKGISAPEKGSTWEECRRKWQEQLDTLAEEFIQGYHEPKPVNASVCAKCDFQGLCRFEG